MRALLIFAACIALLLAGFSVYQQKRLQEARAERDARVAEAEAAAQEIVRNQPTPDPTQSKDSVELLKLRREVTMLRDQAKQVETLLQENLRLKSELERLKQTSATQSQTDSTNYFRRDAWSFAGYNTPEAALVSAIWAMKEGDPVTYLQSLSPDEQQRMAKVWETKSETEVASKHQNDVSAITGFRVLEQQPTANGEMQLRVHIDGVNRTETVRMKLVGTEWKFGGFIRPE